MSDALQLTLTTAGIAAVFNAFNNGFEARITHIALGDANNNSAPGDTGYVIDPAQTMLRNERQRVPVGGGERVFSNQIHMDMLFGNGPSFPVWEVGAFLADGTLFGIWVGDLAPMSYKTDLSDLIFSLDIILQGLPPDSVNVEVSGPSVNITIIAPFAQITTSLIRTQTQIIANDVERLIPIIKNTWS